jgi:hypothetical protein
MVSRESVKKHLHIDIVEWKGSTLDDPKYLSTTPWMIQGVVDVDAYGSGGK